MAEETAENSAKTAKVAKKAEAQPVDLLGVGAVPAALKPAKDYRYAAVHSQLYEKEMGHVCPVHFEVRVNDEKTGLDVPGDLVLKDPGKYLSALDAPAAGYKFRLHRLAYFFGWTAGVFCTVRLEEDFDDAELPKGSILMSEEEVQAVFPEFFTEEEVAADTLDFFGVSPGRGGAPVAPREVDFKVPA